MDVHVFQRDTITPPRVVFVYALYVGEGPLIINRIPHHVPNANYSLPDGLYSPYTHTHYNKIITQL